MPAKMLEIVTPRRRVRLMRICIGLYFFAPPHHQRWSPPPINRGRAPAECFSSYKNQLLLKLAVEALPNHVHRHHQYGDAEDFAEEADVKAL